jgi:hypothetical protein
MRRLLSIIISAVFFLKSSGQQVENPGFELWEDAGTVWDEPVEWSSIKTSDAGEIINGAAPAVWNKSTDHHTGSFSVELTNLAVLDIIAAGTLTNGRVHADFDPDLGYVFTDTLNSQWNTPCTVRPDSLTGWFKFYPQQQDFGGVQALLHVGYGQLPEKVDSANWVGYARFDMQPGVTMDSWTRFSVPFHYYDNRSPQYLLFVLTSGNGTTPAENSVALYDDLALTGGESAIENHPENQFMVRAEHGLLKLYDLPIGFRSGTEGWLRDISGKTIWQGRITSDEISLYHTGIRTGIYIFILQNKESVMTRKVLVH